MVCPLFPFCDPFHPRGIVLKSTAEINAESAARTADTLSRLGQPDDRFRTAAVVVETPALALLDLGLVHALPQR